MLKLHKSCPLAGQLKERFCMNDTPTTVNYLSKLKYSELVELPESRIKQLIDDGKLPHFQSTKKYCEFVNFE